MNILTGAFANPAMGGTELRDMNFQVGANMDQFERVYVGTMTANALGITGDQVGNGAKISLSSPQSATQAIGSIDSALRTVSKQRADLGAYQNRFETAAEGIAIAAENMTAAESVIRDANIAAQMVEYVKDQILVQAGTAMLAQANIRPQSVLQLLA
jgi:flagellin